MYRICTALFLLFGGLLLSTTPAQAISTCLRLNEETFRAGVLAPSDIVLVGTIKRISSTRETDSQWTELSVDRVLRGNVRAPTVLISRWQSYNEPLLTYEKGRKLLVLLTRQDNNLVLVDSRWRYCMPAVMAVDKENTIYPSFVPRDKNLGKRIDLDTFGEYLLK